MTSLVSKADVFIITPVSHLLNFTEIAHVRRQIVFEYPQILSRLAKGSDLSFISTLRAFVKNNTKLKNVITGLKKELIYRKKYDTIDEVKTDVLRF